jgi:hypothetical protein
MRLCFDTLVILATIHFLKQVIFYGQVDQLAVFCVDL